MNAKAEAPCYGFKGSEFITLALAGSGLIATALAMHSRCCHTLPGSLLYAGSSV